MNAERPCPWVSCRHHLYLDVASAGVGQPSIKLNFPDLEPDELEHSCSLDVADAGGAALEVVGDTMNLTRERVRQIEKAALHRVKRRGTLAECAADDADLDRDTLGRDHGLRSASSRPIVQAVLDDKDEQEEQSGIGWRAWSPEILVHGPLVEPVVDRLGPDGLLELGSLQDQRAREDKATMHAAGRMGALYEQRLLGRGLIATRTVSTLSEQRAATKDPKRQARQAAALERLAIAESNLEKGVTTMGQHDETIIAAIRGGTQIPKDIAKAVGLTTEELRNFTAQLVAAGKLKAVGFTSQRRYFLPDQPVPPRLAPAPRKKRAHTGATAPSQPVASRLDRVVVPPALVERAREYVGVEAVDPPGYRVTVFGTVVECSTARAALDLVLLAKASQ